MSTVLSKESAWVLASVIVGDIKAYIENHRAEYEAWLLEEAEKSRQREAGQQKPPVKRRVSRKLSTV